MDPKGWRATRFARLLALSSALFLAAGPGTLSEAASGIGIVGCHVSGNTVLVTLHNSGSASSTGFVVVEAIVGGLSVSSFAPFELSAGETETVGVVFTGTVQGVTRVGTSVEGSAPF